ncbi:MAG: hypothetical protein WD070_04905 [Pirellulaceae bacterium]
MTEEVGVVRRVVWREILPWLIIFRAFRLSVSLPILSLATVGWLLTPVGSQIASALFLGSGDATTTGFAVPLNESTVAYGAFAPYDSTLDIPGFVQVAWASNPIVHVYQHFTDPFVQLFDRSNTVRETAYHLFRGMWSIAIWAFFAGAITRIATVQLGRQERVGLWAAIVYATRQFGWSFVAPLFPLFGVFLASLPLIVLGFVMRTDVGMIVAGVLWPLALAGGLVMTILLLGLGAGWPLMWPTISSEEHGDAFEAFSRSFSYVFQRPLQYLFYLLLAALVGGLGWLLVSHVSEAVIQLTYYGTAWGASNDRIELVAFGEYTGILRVGVELIRLFNGLVRIIAMAFNFSFFFCALTAVYLVIRRDVDKTDLDEVFVDDDQPSYSLPPLESQEDNPPTAPAATEVEKGEDAGAPSIDDGKS